MSTISREDFHRRYGGDVVPASRESSHRLYTPAKDVEVLASLIRHFGCRSVMEIGINQGATAHWLLTECPSIERYVGVDVEAGYVTPLEAQRAEVPERPGEIVVADPRLRIIVRPRGSYDLTSADFLDEIDFVFIDGDHSEAAVLHDTRIARLLMRNGIVTWHDYEPGKTQVMQAVDALNAVDDRICHVLDTAVCYELRGRFRG